jgi:hypothetical protein
MSDAAANPLSALVEKLKRYPHVGYRLVRSGCEIDPPNDGGFKIGLSLQGDSWVVTFGEGGMHEHFSDPADALDFVAFGLSDSCRLRETVAPFVRRSIVERRDQSGWTRVYEVGTLSWPVAFRTRERVFQNTLIKD